MAAFPAESLALGIYLFKAAEVSLKEGCLIVPLFCILQVS